MGRAKDGSRAKDGASLKREAERIVSDAAAQKAAEADDRVRILRKELDALKRQVRDHAGATALLVDTVKSVYCEKPEIRLPPFREIAKGYKETAVLHVSDIHVGKRTPEYDTAKCRERMRLLARKTLEITRLRRGNAEIGECVVLLGGDMIEGEGIFPGQAWECDGDLEEQATKNAPEILAELIATLAADFGKIRVHVVPGNHGQNGRHGSKRTNWDSVACLLAEHITRQKVVDADKRITWDQPNVRSEEWYTLCRVEGWGCLLIHGHQIRGQLGFPWYGTGKKMAGWVDTIPEGWDYLFMGHFHTLAAYAVNHRTVLANGSSESRNVYARENLAASGFPSQRLAFFNRKHGLIVDCPIILSDERKPK